MNPKDDINKFKKFLDVQSSKEENTDNKKIIDLLKGMAENGEEEMIRINTEFDVERPEDSEEVEYVCLHDILQAGFKTPEVDENGYSLSRPVFNTETPTLDLGIYKLASSTKSFLSSRLYSRYTDEPTIIFRERDNKVFYFLPKEDESFAIKMSGLEGYGLKESAQGLFYLEYIYLMMSIPQFSKQFPKGMNIKSVLKGWIPVMPIEAQKILIETDRKTNFVDFVGQVIY